MFVRRVAMPLVLVFVVLFAQSAQAFFDPPWITPENPIAGEAVSVNIHGGYCDIFLEEVGFPRITQEGNEVRIIIYGAHYEPGSELCVFPDWTGARQIGTFPTGNYTLTVDLAYEHPVFGPSILNIGVVPFSVAAPPEPVSVPTFGLLGAAILLLGLVVFGAFRTRRLTLVIAMVACTSFDVRAQAVGQACVRPTAAPGAPTPEQIMNWVNSPSRSSPPPLDAFKVKAPLGSYWLIPDRATGDFLNWLNNNTNSARKKLEDCQLLTFALADFPAALAALQADPYVAEATVSPEFKLHSVDLIDFEIVPEGPLGGDDQYGWFSMDLDGAWRLAGGYSLVAQVDMGIYASGAAFRQFDSGIYAGGNLIQAASKDVSLTGRPAQSGFNESDVDEKKPMWINAGSCTSGGSLMPPSVLGHGTHVAGLLGANGASGLGVQGTCKHCGIQAYKAAYLLCAPDTTPPQVQPFFNTNASNRARAQAVDTGVQVISMSFGHTSSSGLYDCRVAYRDYPMCWVIAYATGRDIAQVASSGNDRSELDFPASDKRVISVGGFNPLLTFWDEHPSCPLGSSIECGSNFSQSGSSGYRTHQELVGSAKHALSTTYPNTNWVDYAECGDGYGTPMGDGVGWCTGTSMSAPQVAGVVGLLRSINPLAPQGVPEPAAGEKPGLRTVLAQTASRMGAWDSKLGYGIPNAAAAARRVLGKAAGGTVRNRATPLFRLYQATTKDFAETTSPQYALSLMVNQDKNYAQPASSLGAQPKEVPGYTFPYDTNDPADANDTFDTTLPPAPRAAIYVLTTEYRPRNEWPDLRPLHLMDKNASGGRDYLLATTKAEIEAAHTAGYNLRTIQGYIYQPCTPEPTCIPPDAEKLWRQYKATDNDCATFLNSEKPAFEAAGYMTACPTGATKMIGYAYPATDTDSDGLPDGFERVVGTNRDAADSDGDGIADATEFPLAGIATGDPCMGGSLGARNCGADIIFRNGFNT